MLRKEKTQRPTMKDAAEELAKHLSRQTGGTLAARLPVEAITDGDACKHDRTVDRRVKQPAATRSGLVIRGVGVLVMGVLVAAVDRSETATETSAAATAKPSIAETAEPKQRDVPILAQISQQAAESHQRKRRSQRRSQRQRSPAPAVAAKPKDSAERKESDKCSPRTREQDSSEETVWI
jgi:hypothetical protein